MIGQTPAETDSEPSPETSIASAPETNEAPVQLPEYGGRDGPDPTRYGDWEKNGRCIDF